MFDLNQALATTGGATLKPETVGETLGGTITAVEVRQMRDFSTGKPDHWDDGNPKTQIVVTVDTGQKTPDGDSEQGSIYIKTWGEQKQAIVQAIKATGLDANSALAPGNRLEVTYRGEKPNEKNPHFNPTKIYEYTVTPRARLDGVLDAQKPAQTTQQAVPQGVPQPQAQAGSGDSSPAQTARSLIAAGVDTQTIATATGLDPNVIETLRQ